MKPFWGKGGKIFVTKGTKNDTGPPPWGRADWQWANLAERHPLVGFADVGVIAFIDNLRAISVFILFGDSVMYFSARRFSAQLFTINAHSFPRRCCLDPIFLFWRGR